MSLAGSQQQTGLQLLGALRPHWRKDRRLPARIQTLLAQNPAFGSRDRRLYRELIYTTLRYLPWIEPMLGREPARAGQVIAWLAADTPATHAFRAALLEGWPPCPVTVAERAAYLQMNAPVLPAWFREDCPEAFIPGQTDALLARAPLWLRLQTLRPEEVFSEFDARGWSWQRSAVLPSAVQLRTEADVTRSDSHRHGLVEVQDLGSQMVLACAGVEAGGSWLDACAGAGGKSLQLAGLLGPSGRVDAYDVRPAALAELTARARRAGLANITTLRAPPAAGYDTVLVDAPCSGSGTWRRAPHLKWTTTSAQVAADARRQLTLLGEFSRRVNPGGRLIYATCSLSQRENAAVVRAFLATHPEFAPAGFAATFGFTPDDGGLTILPARHDTDGFFVAVLRRGG